jgi:uncharacterized membrane protein YphA (DoxX/SURF4 family)
MKRFSLKSSSSDFLFRFGLSVVFLVNSLTAWFSPDEFLELLKNNPLVSAIANPHFWIYIIGINDSILFLLILAGRWRRTIAVWAALWMIAVIYITINEGAIEFIEHIGILSLIIYYHFAFRRSFAER